jgi:dephospho-CoA kinase
MKVIGILGGVASGKSLVGDQFRRLGAEVLNADQVAHEVLREEEVIKSLHGRWGDDVIGDDNQINRAAVANIVFAPPPDGPNQLAFLEQVVHPRIGSRLKQRLEQLRCAGETAVVILDAAVMLKVGWDKFCNQILFVETPQTIREQRARRRGWNEAEFTAREDAQQPLDRKRKAASFVIDNSGTLEATFAQVQQFWKSLS